MGQLFERGACLTFWPRGWALIRGRTLRARVLISGFHCHAIKIKIENHPLNEVKKLARYR